MGLTVAGRAKILQVVEVVKGILLPLRGQAMMQMVRESRQAALLTSAMGAFLDFFSYRPRWFQ